MIDKIKFDYAVSKYKIAFNDEWWNEEKFKWEAIKCFQENWNIEQEDFIEMFTNATAKTYNLLASNHNYPRGMIIEFAQKETETVKNMFIDLYNEDIDLSVRVNQFKEKSEELRQKYSDGTWNNHYQNENSISTYLWLKYPDKYYIYKYSEVRKVAKLLDDQVTIKAGKKIENLITCYEFYDQINELLKKDLNLINILKSRIESEQYDDSKLKTLTIDFGFFVSRFLEEKNNIYWPTKEEYDPCISKDKWLELLNNRNIFFISNLEIMKRLLDIGGEATCKQLSDKYGETFNFYNTGSSRLAKRIASEIGCTIMQYEDNLKYWPILYVGRNASQHEEGSWVWKLRDELYQALQEIDLSNIDLYSQNIDERTELNYWWLTASPAIWSYSNLAVGEEQNYTLYNDNGNKRRIFQNFLDAKEGDIVIGYESKPIKKIVAICEISHENDGQNLYFKKIEGLTNGIEYCDIKSNSELQNMEYLVNPQGSLFKLTTNEYNCIMDMIRETNPKPQDTSMNCKKYDKSDFLDEVYMSPEKYDSIVSLLKNKKNIILQGAPGVGKTFAAKRLAFSMMGCEDEDRVGFIQFHQNYTYEDFIKGYKPKDDGFELKDGIFYSFCKIAFNHPDKDYFFIIDEINRGNLSKIFGELLMMIEKSYRGKKVTLAYDGMTFVVPENLYIIGMMNTADRSLAIMDYALRRRFSFVKMGPAFNSEGFKRYKDKISNDIFNDLIDVIKKLNKQISEDDSLGEGFCIGHSYFCGQEDITEEWMNQVIDYDIIPTLEEYWFDNQSEVEKWKSALHGVINGEG